MKLVTNLKKTLSKLPQMQTSLEKEFLWLTDFSKPHLYYKES